MKNVKLGDVISISPGKVSFDGTEKVWLLNLDMIEQQTGKIIQKVIVEPNEMGNSITSFDKDNVLYSKLRPNLNIVVLPEEAGYATSEILPLRIKDKKILTREYLVYYLRSPNFVNWAINKTAGAKMPRLSTKELMKAEIPLIDIEEQEKLARTMSALDKATSNRQHTLTLLDELVKSRFVEMFGDPSVVNARYPYLPIDSLCDDIFGGGTPSKKHPEYYTGSIPWVTPKDMKSELIKDSIDHITDDAVKNSTTRKIPAGAVLMVIRSGILKHTLPVAINTREVTVNQDMKAFVTSDKITAPYLMYTFKLQNFAGA